MAPDRISFTTDNALLVLYDPKGMRHRVRAPHSWWNHAVKSSDFAKLDEVRDGRFAIWPLGGRGGRYAVRVRKGELTDVEKPFVKGAISGLGVVVESGQLFVGPGERIPGEGFGDRIVVLDDSGALFPFENGRYLSTVHVLDWKGEAHFFDEEGEPLADAPSDFVITLAPSDAPFAPPRPVPALLDFVPKPAAPKTVSTSALVNKIAARPRSVEVGRPAAQRGERKKREQEEWHPSPDPLPPPKPGEIRVGMRVRHQQHGEGTVLFVREGFPKLKIDFRGVEVKVDRSEVEVV